LNRPVEKEAREIYEEFRALSDRKLPVLGKISLSMSRLYSSYALYLVLDQEGNSKANQLLNEIIRIDPDCVLAARQQRQSPPLRRHTKATARPRSRSASRQK
jgi:hypothetical protein